MDNTTFVGDFPLKTQFREDFEKDRFDYQMVRVFIPILIILAMPTNLPNNILPHACATGTSDGNCALIPALWAQK